MIPIYAIDNIFVIYIHPISFQDFVEKFIMDCPKDATLHLYSGDLFEHANSYLEFQKEDDHFKFYQNLETRANEVVLPLSCGRGIDVKGINYEILTTRALKKLITLYVFTKFKVSMKPFDREIRIITQKSECTSYPHVAYFASKPIRTSKDKAVYQDLISLLRQGRAVAIPDEISSNDKISDTIRNNDSFYWKIVLPSDDDYSNSDYNSSDDSYSDYFDSEDSYESFS